MILKPPAHFCRSNSLATSESRQIANSEGFFSKLLVHVAEVGGHLAGVVQITPNGKIADLAKLFVEPFYFGSGVGRQLFAWAENTARTAGAALLVIESDPNAADFYRRMGAVDDGLAPSGSIPGRFIPRLRLKL
ncbi:MAG: GNAT family N-acetyltransferase [Rhizomicrobium sp.]